MSIWYLKFEPRKKVIHMKYVIVLEFGFILLNIENNVEDLVMSNSFRHSVFRQTLVFSSFHTRWMDEKSAVQHLVCQNGVRLWWSPTSERYSCCWWFRNPVNSPVEGTVVYPIIFEGVIHPSWLFEISEPSTVSYLSQCVHPSASASLLRCKASRIPQLQRTFEANCTWRKLVNKQGLNGP